MQLVLLVGIVSTVLVLCAASSSSSSSSRQESPGAPPLAPELKRLELWVGQWDAEVTMMGQTVQGRETCRIDCGGRWLITEHESSFMGAPYLGKGFTGWDDSKQAYSGAWIDSSGGPMSVFANGQFSKDGKTFTSQVDALGMDGKPGRFEYVSTFPDAKKRSFEIFQIDGGKRELQMSIRYTRRG